MKYFSLPVDFKKETIDAYDALNRRYPDARVVETYGSITRGVYFSSGRLARQMTEADLFDLHDYIRYAQTKDIGFNYTMNAPFLHNREFTQQGIKEIKIFLGQLYEAGVRELTVTLPSLMELIQSTDYDFTIKASCICQITNPSRALFYKNLGVKRMVVDESINRDFKNLENIRKAFGDQVEVIANQVCDLNCVYRMFHYNMISGEPEGSVNETGVDFYEHRCVLQQFKNRYNLLKLSWIRPEDLHYYTDIGIHYFKLQGRHTFVKKGDPLRTVECYFKESHDGNLMDLLTMFATMNNFKVHVDNKKLAGFLKPFVEKENFCRHNCTDCKYCEAFARRAIDLEGADEIIEMARQFYDRYDRYKKLIHTVNPVSESPLEEAQVEADFDL
jgi:collagenase-like PrtC family protease